MKKIFLFLIIFFLFYDFSFWNYQLENWSKQLIDKYNFSLKNLDRPISRKEFVDTLFLWYKDYRIDRKLYVNYDKYTSLDNSKYFIDIDLKSDFWKKLEYLTYIWAFKKNKYFNGNWLVNQKIFFTVLKRLSILNSLQACKNLKICEKEADENTYFSKWVYYRYVSKILDKKLRKYYSTPVEYLNDWYKPFLNNKYNFPILTQTLNWCYAFTIRNILKYQYWIGIYVNKAETIIWKEGDKLWNNNLMNKFDNLVNVKRKHFYNIDTLINSLQVWEPVWITYLLTYYSSKEKKQKTISHIVAAYSFDEKWVWVSETVSNKRLQIPWDEIFDKNWNTKYNRIFKFYYTKKEFWNNEQYKLHKTNKVLVWNNL